MLEWESTETVYTAEEGGTVVSKICVRFCAAIARVKLGGRGGTESKMGLHGMGGRNDVAHRYVGSMVVGVNTSWVRMSGSEIMAVTRDGLCCWRRDSAIIILLILTPKQYS